MNYWVERIAKAQVALTNKNIKNTVSEGEDE